MKNRFKNGCSAGRQRSAAVYHVVRSDIMTGYLSEEFHKKLRSLNKKRTHVH